MNLASDPTTVGMPHVLAGVFGLGSTVAREVSFVSGMILMLLTIPLLAAKHVPQEQTPLPLLLLLGPVFFGARSYDLVFVIPMFVWFLRQRGESRGGASALSLLLLLLVPQKVVTFIQVDLVHASQFLDTLFNAYRSWIVLSLLVVAASVIARRSSAARLPAS